MKKNLIKLVLFLVILFLLPINSSAKSLCDEIGIDDLSKHLEVNQKVQPKIVLKNEINDKLCRIILAQNNRHMVLYVGKDFVIAGTLFKNKEQIDQNLIKDLETKNIKVAIKDLDNYVTFSKKPHKEIKYILYAITDPNCSHCKYGVNEILSMMEHYGVYLKIIVMPIYPESVPKAIEAYCQHISIEGYMDPNWLKRPSSPETQCEKGKKFVERVKKKSEEIINRGVPIFIIKDKRNNYIDHVVGSNMKRIMEILDGKPLIAK